MEIIESHVNFGSGTTKGIWGLKDGRHFCGSCHKMLRVGDSVTEHSSPGFRCRMTKNNYEHTNACASQGSKDNGKS